MLVDIDYFSIILIFTRSMYISSYSTIYSKNSTFIWWNLYFSDLNKSFLLLNYLKIFFILMM